MLNEYKIEEYANDILDNFKMSKKEELIKELEQLQERVFEIKSELMANYKDFETWYIYADKENYDFLIDKKQAPLFRKYFIDNDIYGERYSTLHLRDVLDRIDDEYSDLSKEEVEGLKQELMDLNFNSMVYDW